MDTSSLAGSGATTEVPSRRPVDGEDSVKKGKKNAPGRCMSPTYGSDTCLDVLPRVQGQHMVTALFAVVITFPHPSFVLQCTFVTATMPRRKTRPRRIAAVSVHRHILHRSFTLIVACLDAWNSSEVFMLFAAHCRANCLHWQHTEYIEGGD